MITVWAIWAPDVYFYEVKRMILKKTCVPCRREAIFEPSRSDLAAFGRGDPCIKELFSLTDAPLATRHAKLVPDCGWHGVAAKVPAGVGGGLVDGTRPAGP